MKNLELWEKVRAVPAIAIKPIGGGRLKGMSDINPMWRIKKLTEEFGPVGFGWFYEILEERLEPLPDGQIAAFVKINLYVTKDGNVSMPITGLGGNMFRVQESKGMYTNDECFKMALTDALSVACKALGIGADIYWSSDKSKYDEPEMKQETQEKESITKKLGSMIMDLAENDKEKAKELFKQFTSFTDKDGKHVEGKETLKGMSDKAIQVAYGKVKVEWLKLNKGDK